MKQPKEEYNFQDFDSLQETTSNRSNPPKPHKDNLQLITTQQPMLSPENTIQRSTVETTNLNINPPTSSITDNNNTNTVPNTNKHQTMSVDIEPLHQNEPSLDRQSTINNSFQQSYLSKMKTMEHLISVIKEHSIDRYKKDLELKLQLKHELENNVEILSSYIKTNRVNKREFSTLYRTIEKENDRLLNVSEKAREELQLFNKQLPLLRSEINQMQKQISTLNDETKQIRTEKMNIEREIISKEDDIRTYNKLISNFRGSKDNIKASITLLKKHSCLIKEKIKGVDDKGKELFGSLRYLARKSVEDGEEYDKLNRKFDMLKSRLSVRSNVSQLNSKDKEEEK